MPSTSMFDRGASNNFFDPAIFDTAVHFTSSLTETITVSDGLDRTLTALRTLSETVSDTDALAGGRFIPSNISEPSISDVDSLAGVQILSRSISDTVSVLDSVDRTLLAIRQIFEFGHAMFDSNIFDSAIFDTTTYPINISDSVSATQSLFRTISEPSITISDSLDRVQLLNRTLVELTISVSDTLDRTASFARNISEPSISDIDSITRTLVSFRTISEPSTTITDSVARAIIYNRILNELITISDRVSGTTPVGGIRFVSRIKESMDLISRVKEILNISSRVI